MSVAGHKYIVLTANLSQAQFKCDSCRKVFVSEFHLNGHEKRRHTVLSDSNPITTIAQTTQRIESLLVGLEQKLSSSFPPKLMGEGSPSGARSPFTLSCGGGDGDGDERSERVKQAVHQIEPKPTKTFREIATQTESNHSEVGVQITQVVKVKSVQAVQRAEAREVQTSVVTSPQVSNSSPSHDETYCHLTASSSQTSISLGQMPTEHREVLRPGTLSLLDTLSPKYRRVLSESLSTEFLSKKFSEDNLSFDMGELQSDIHRQKLLESEHRSMVNKEKLEKKFVSVRASLSKIMEESKSDVGCVDYAALLREETAQVADLIARLTKGSKIPYSSPVRKKVEDDLARKMKSFGLNPTADAISDTTLEQTSSLIGSKRETTSQKVARYYALRQKLKEELDRMAESGYTPPKNRR